jgi:hypothetical protein
VDPFGEFRLRESVGIDQSAAVVWPYLIAFEQVPTWEEGVTEVRQLTAGEPAVGTKIVARRMYGREESTVQGVITDYQPGRSATMTIIGGPVLVSHATYEVQPIDDVRCRVVYSVRATMRGPVRLLTPILPTLGKRVVRRNLARLRRRVMAGIPPRSDEQSSTAEAG